ncbi:fructosamine kinase family protein [Plebeiibacterium marinum]|uniref:Fructosamine kinase family protein n=1 Tax=Plebeiibacterium marinum TaxID=2992111 RepID=A0AAE3MH74_9BACT|nr:fructosamine kinase family protein [Plebeiobacterium marinum]MCW3807531.1 fructosamine kinase family protein [Plebeiobacterium marinum]
MNSVLNRIEEFLGEDIVSDQGVGGGCIANSKYISTSNGNRFFLKQGFSNGMFQCEANGLLELARAKTIKVPKVISVAQDYLLLEYIEQGNESKDFFDGFGKQFANMHRFTQKNFGFYEDNFIGKNKQPNKISKDWCDFYFNERLLFQYKLAEKNGYVTDGFKKAFDRLEKRIMQILNGSEEEPALLHGDLWGGNYVVDSLGNAVLIDPAVYYGHREADLAMTKLFGGFSADFYRSYNEIFPLKDGFEYRENVYKLYHVLNHLNLFGVGYYGPAIDLMNFYK